MTNRGGRTLCSREGAAATLLVVLFAMACTGGMAAGAWASGARNAGVVHIVGERSAPRESVDIGRPSTAVPPAPIVRPRPRPRFLSLDAGGLPAPRAPGR